MHLILCPCFLVVKSNIQDISVMLFHVPSEIFKTHVLQVTSLTLWLIAHYSGIGLLKCRAESTPPYHLKEFIDYV